MEVGKVIKRGEDFFFLLVTFENDGNFFGSTKMGIFYWEKAFKAGKQNQEK